MSPLHQAIKLGKFNHFNNFNQQQIVTNQMSILDDLEMMKILVNNGADINALGCDFYLPETPREMAKRFGTDSFIIHNYYVIFIFGFICRSNRNLQFISEFGEEKQFKL